MSVPIPYRPSCGSEGADFMSRWCDRCERDRAFREDDGDSCPIAAATMIYERRDPAYPPEWREDGPQGPRCTAFVLTGDSVLSPLDEANQLGLFGSVAA